MSRLGRRFPARIGLGMRPDIAPQVSTVQAPWTLANNADGGTSGTTVTAGNSGGGSGNAFDAVSIGTGVGLTFDATNQAHGSGLAYKIAQPATVAAGYLEWNTTLSALTRANQRIAGRLYYVPGAAIPTSSVRLVQVLNGSTILFSIYHASGTGHLEIHDSAGTLAGSAHSVALVAGTLYRIEFDMQGVGGGSAAGTGLIRLFLGDGTTAQGTDATSTASNFGSLQPTIARFGFTTANGTASVNSWIDAIQLNNSGVPGPEVSTTITDSGTSSALGINSAAFEAIGDDATTLVAVGAQTDAEAIADSGTHTAAQSTPSFSPAAVASDTFTRTVSGSWGTIESGGTGWTNTSGIAGDASVDGAEALISWSAGHTAHHQQAGVSVADIDQTIKLRGSALMNSGSWQLALLARVNGATFARGVLIVDNSGAVSGEIRKVVAGASSVITNGSGTFAALSTYTANTWLWMRFQVIGSTWSLKVWVDGNTEPGAFDIVGTEAVDVQAAGDAGVRAITLTGTTLPVFQFDSYSATSPSPIAVEAISDTGTSVAAASHGVRTLLYSDTFTRTVAAGGWGTADSGQAWSALGTTTASMFSTNGAAGQVTITTNSTQIEGIDAGGALADGDVYMDVMTTGVPTSGQTENFGIGVRTQGTNPEQNYYRVRIILDPAGGNPTIELAVVSANVATVLATATAGFAYSANAWWRIHVAMLGSHIQVRAWPVASAEPTTWDIDTTDSTWASGGFLVRAQVGTVRPVINFDNLVAYSTVLQSITTPVGNITDSGESDALASQTVTGESISDTGTSTALGVFTSSQAIVDQATQSAAGTQSGSDAIADSTASSALAVFLSSQAIADQGTPAGVAPQSGSESFSDSTTSTAAALFTSTEAITDQGTILAVASQTAVEAGADTGTSATTGSQTGSESISDTGTSSALAVHTGAQADSGTSTATGAPSAQEAIQDANTALGLASNTGVDALADSTTISALASFTGAEIGADSGTSANTASQSGSEALQDASTAISSGLGTGLDALADAGESDALASFAGIGADTGTSGGTGIQSGTESFTDQSTMAAAGAPSGAEAFADQGTVVAVGVPGSDATSGSGTSTGVGSQTGTESITDQGTLAAAGLFTASEAFADQGTVTAVAAPSTGATADSGTSAATGSQTVTGESITDQGTLVALQSTPSPVEQDVDSGTSTSTATQTAQESLVDSGTVAAAASQSGAQGDSTTSTALAVASAAEAISDQGESDALATQGVVSTTQSGESDATALHTGTEALADQGTIAAQEADFGAQGDSGTATAAASQPTQPPFITDTFTRTASSLGSTTPDSHPWTTQFGASSWAATNGSQAVFTPNSIVSSGYTVDDSSSDVEVQFDFAVTQWPQGTNFTIAPMVRYDPFNGGQYIRAAVSVTANGGHYAIQLTKVIGGNGTSITSSITVITTPVLNTVYRVKLRVVGFWVGAKVWDPSGAEPDWQVVGQLLPSDGVNVGNSGIRVQTLAGTTTQPIVTVDNFLVTTVIPVEQVADSGISTHPTSQTVTGEAISDQGTNTSFGFTPLPDLNDSGTVSATAVVTGVDAPYEVGEVDALASHSGLANTPDFGTNSSAAALSGVEAIADQGENDATAVTFAPPASDSGTVAAQSIGSGLDAFVDQGEVDAVAVPSAFGAVVESPIVVASATASGTEQISDTGTSVSSASTPGLDAFAETGQCNALATTPGNDFLADSGLVTATATSTAGDAQAATGNLVATATISGTPAVAESQISASHATQQVLSESISDAGTESALASTPVPFVGNIDQGTNTSTAAQSGAEAKVDRGSVAAAASQTGTGVVAAIFDSGTSVATAVATGTGGIGFDSGTSVAHAAPTGSEQVVDRGVVAAAASNTATTSWQQQGTNTATAIGSFVSAFTESGTLTAITVPSGAFGWSDIGTVAVVAAASVVEQIADSTISTSQAIFSSTTTWTDQGTVVANGVPSGFSAFVESSTVTARSSMSSREALAESDIAISAAAITGFGAPSESPIVVAHATISGQDAKQDQGSAAGHASFAYALSWQDVGTGVAIASMSGTFFFGDRGTSTATAVGSGLEKFIDTGRNTAIVSASAAETISAAGTVVAIGLPTGSQQFTQAGANVAQAIIAGLDVLGDSGVSASAVILTEQEALREVGSVVAHALISGDVVLADQGFLVAKAIHSGAFVWPDSGTNTALAIITGLFDTNLVIKGVVSVLDFAVATVFLLDYAATAAAHADDAAAQSFLTDAPVGDVSTADSEAYTVSVGDS